MGRLALTHLALTAAVAALAADPGPRIEIRAEREPEPDMFKPVLRKTKGWKRVPKKHQKKFKKRKRK